MKTKELTQKLLEWYQTNGRNLPWRFKGGAHPTPYIVLVSEIMLQQTTVKTVIPYFTKFIQRFPNIQSLAQADIEEVYRYWQGLGYYTRARSLHKTAQTIVNDYHGEFPSDKEKIKKLKGIGQYTLSSFLALSFNQAETVIDGNVKRIICRLHHLTEPLDSLTSKIEKLATRLTSKDHAADYASAIMDLGATICTPKKPHCDKCPWQSACQSKNQTDLEQIPIRKKLSKQERNGSVYIIKNHEGKILIRKRTEKGLLSGLYEFPWTDSGELKNYAAYCRDTHQSISHTFSHFKLNLKIYTLTNNQKRDEEIFASPDELIKNYPFSTLMKKVWKTVNSIE